MAPQVGDRTLAAWRSRLEAMRGEERDRYGGRPAETGRLLETVRHALVQGGLPVPPDEIARIEEPTVLNAGYGEIGLATPTSCVQRWVGRMRSTHHAPAAISTHQAVR